MKWYCDGSGFNGTVSKFCVCNDDGYSTTIRLAQNYTNNEMEYAAFIWAAVSVSIGDVVCSDSQLVVRQISGMYAVREKRLLPLNQAAKLLLKNNRIDLQWVPREENPAGKALEKDKGNNVVGTAVDLYSAMANNLPILQNILNEKRQAGFDTN